MDSTLQVYLEDINAAELLSAEEEVELARRIQQNSDQEARDKMIRANLRLVVNIAKHFSRRGMPLADLIEEGNLGLLRAVEGYDPDNGARFSTYASWWIKQAIKRALINTVQPVHIPAYMVELVARWKYMSAELRDKLGREPDAEEMAQALEIPAKKARIIRRAVKAFASSGQMPVGEDGDSINEMLEDDKTPRPDANFHSGDNLDTIKMLLDKIDKREATVLRLRYGLENEQGPLTLKEIGEKIGLTRERVRQIEKEALAKLYQFVQELD